MCNDNMDLRYDVGDKSMSVRMDNKCRLADRDVRMRLRHNTRGKAGTLMECVCSIPSMYSYTPRTPPLCKHTATSMEAMVDVNDNNKAIVVYDLSNWDGADMKKMSLKWRYTKDDLSVEPGYNFGTESLFVDARYKYVVVCMLLCVCV